MSVKQIIVKTFSLARSPYNPIQDLRPKDDLRKRLSRANAAPLTQTELEEKKRKDREWQRKCRYEGQF